MEHKLTLFDGNRIWKRYQRLFESIREADSSRKLDSLERKVDTLSQDLAKAIEDRQSLADLRLVLHSELERRRDQLHQSRGQPEEPDSLLILRDALVRLEADRRLAEALLDAGTDHAWARTTLLTSLGHSVATVEDHANLLKATGRAAEAAAELAEAEANLGPARAVLRRGERQ